MMYVASAAVAATSKHMPPSGVGLMLRIGFVGIAGIWLVLWHAAKVISKELSRIVLNVLHCLLMLFLPLTVEPCVQRLE